MSESFLAAGFVDPAGLMAGRDEQVLCSVAARDAAPRANMLIIHVNLHRVAAGLRTFFKAHEPFVCFVKVAIYIRVATARKRIEGPEFAPAAD
jgi:hypothetical protein